MATRYGISASPVARISLSILLAFVLACAFSLTSEDCAFAAKAGLKASGAAHVVKSASKVKAANVRNRASVATVYCYGWDNGVLRDAFTGSASNYDVTGDARADEVSVRLSQVDGDTGLARGVAVDVNGSTAYELRVGSSLVDRASVHVITLKNNAPFLFVGAFGVGGTAKQVVLQYEDGVFKVVASNGLLSRKGVSNAYISKVRATGNRVIVQYEFASTVTGISRTSFTYAYRRASLVRTSDTTNALLFATMKSGAYTKQARRTANAFTAYTSVSLKKKAFSVGVGKRVRPLAIRISGGSLLYKVRYGKLVGWIRAADAGAYKGGKLFADTYGSAPLSNTPPAYSESAAMNAADLQCLSNHALYLARNEIYARHGRTFSTGELKEHFSSLSWYSPRAEGATPLNNVEKANVERILDIEHARRSPYVF